jgi:TRAP-type C4-dicarboxylate transport system permease small subunit
MPTPEGSEETPPPHDPPRGVPALASIIRLWALLGGVVTLALSLMTAVSAVSNLLLDAPFAADYELVKHFIAIAVFMFLPYCQLTGSNVTVDIFTERMSERAKAVMAALSSLFAIAFALLLLKQMSEGLISYLRFVEVTPVLRLPLWTAFPPILISLFLLLLAAIITSRDAWNTFCDRRTGPPSERRIPVE